MQLLVEHQMWGLLTKQMVEQETVQYTPNIKRLSLSTSDPTVGF